MSRLDLNDNTLDIVVKMSEGNPGAISAMTEIIDKHVSIDPQGAMGGVGAIMILDTWGIYGADIYVLYSDKCGKDVRKMLMLMRATQLGIFSDDKLKAMAADQCYEVNLTEDEFNELDEKVCAVLTDFAKAS